MLDVARTAPAAPSPAEPAHRRPRRPWRGPLVTAAGLVVLSAASVLLVRSGVMGVGFWIDEGLSVGIADRPLLDIPGALRQDGSPPLYYMLLHLWMPLFGQGEEATRVLSLLLATLSIPVAWWVARRLFGVRAGWIAAVLAASNPFLTQYGQETRMYTLVVLAGIVTTAAFVAAFALRRRGWLPVFAAGLVIQLYTHNWALFFGAATGLAWLMLLWLAPGDERRTPARDGALAYGAVAVAYLPWLPSLLFQAAHTGAPWAQAPGPDMLLDAFGRLLGMDAQLIILLVGGLGFAALVRPRGGGPAWRDRLQPEGRAVLALLVCSLGTFVIAWLASQVSPAWALRYLAVGLPPLLLLTTLGLARAGTVGLFATAVVVGIWAINEPPKAKSNVREIAAGIAPSLRPGDLVVSTQPEQIPVMAYYLPDGLRYATLWGPVDDLGVTDWRDGVERLERTRADRDLRPLIDALRPGQRLALVQPIIYDRERWSAPWTTLIRKRSLEWERAADADARLRPVTHRPVTFTPPAPNPVAATVYERVGG